MNAFIEGAKSDITIIPLILANLVPLLGVLIFGWSVFYVLIFYWLESLAVGFFNVLKMALAKGIIGATESGAKSGHAPKGIIYLIPGAIGKIFMIGFFIFHYSTFMFVHLIFIFVLSSIGIGGQSGGINLFDTILQIFIASVAIFASHGISFAINYVGKKEYEKADASKIMMAPYARIIVMHITIIGGAFLMLATSSPTALISIFIALKTAVDVVAHLKEHQNYSSA